MVTGTFGAAPALWGIEMIPVSTPSCASVHPSEKFTGDGPSTKLSVRASNR